MRKLPPGSTTGAIVPNLRVGSDLGMVVSASDCVMRMRILPTLAVFATAAAPVVACQPSSSSPPPKRQLRGAWIASVENIDWPSRAGLPVAAQQAEYRALLDDARRIGLNSVFVQVRPTADAFYASTLEPWSRWLTGVPGRDPGYDVLAFLVEEAHARNLDFHAWFNPYRVSKHDRVDELALDHPARVHPDWLRAYGGQLYFDPGVPAARAHIEAVVLDVVRRYDIDGVHLDDYFYPYPVEGRDFPDDDTFRRYGDGFTNRDDWRRHNVDLLVSELHAAIHAAKPWLRFGISPFGIWSNSSSDPTGSQSSGFEAYSGIYADSRSWIRNRWVDYVVPQLYWTFRNRRAPYDVLARWWAREVSGTGVDLYIGQAAYKIGDDGWTDPREMVRHLELDRSLPEIVGEVYFSLTKLRANRLGAVDLLRAGPYAHPALVPGPRTADVTPARLVIIAAERTPRGIALTWTSPAATHPVAYVAVYRFNGERAIDARDVASAASLVATTKRVNDGPQQWVDATAQPGTTYTYVVTALDRQHRESGIVTRTVK